MAEHDLNYDSREEEENRMFMKFDEQDELSQKYDTKDRQFIKKK